MKRLFSKSLQYVQTKNMNMNSYKNVIAFFGSILNGYLFINKCFCSVPRSN